MPAPRQMFDHWLEALKGWPSPYAVDFTAKLAAAVTIDPVFKGRVVHLNDDGEFEMGVAAAQMAIFLLQNSDDADVVNEGGDSWEAIQPTGVMSGLVACGAYELESTEFDGAETYLPNDTLTAGTSNVATATGGVLAPGVAYTDAICGVVSRGERVNANKKAVLSFWPVFLPA